MTWPTATIWRCHACRRGFFTTEQLATATDALRCPCCECVRFVPVKPTSPWTLGDRWRLWRQTGHAPWTRRRLDPELS